MRLSVERGVAVIVRTHGNRPSVLKLWLAGPKGCVVADERAFQRLLAGDSSGAVAVPTEDVFRYDAAIAKVLNPREPFGDWARLRPYRGE